MLISMIDPIKYIFEKPALSGRITRWKMVSTEYNIQYTTQKAIKGSVLADHLAHQEVDDYQSMNFEFSDAEPSYQKPSSFSADTIDRDTTLSISSLRLNSTDHICFDTIRPQKV